MYDKHRNLSTVFTGIKHLFCFIGTGIKINSRIKEYLAFVFPDIEFEYSGRVSKTGKSIKGGIILGHSGQTSERPNTGQVEFIDDFALQIVDINPRRSIFHIIRYQPSADN